MTNEDRIADYLAKLAESWRLLSPTEATLARADYYHRAERGTRYQQHVLHAPRRFRATILTLRRKTK